MINFIYLAAGFIVGGFILFLSSNATNPEVFYIMSGLGFVVFAIWIGCIIAELQTVIKSQLEDFHSLESLKSQKASYQSEMDAYNKEMKNELLQRYREFEQELMVSIKDSKLIATMLEKSGYATVLSEYNSQIKKYLNSIHQCDRSIQDKIASMRVRQNNTFYGYSKLLPKNTIYVSVDD